MRMSVLATEVCASEKTKHVEAIAMHAATASIGRPPARHCATIPRRRAIDSTTARKVEAKRPRQRLVVHGVVASSRTRREPLLQHTAAPATSSAPVVARSLRPGSLDGVGAAAGEEAEELDALAQAPLEHRAIAQHLAADGEDLPRAEVEAP